MAALEEVAALVQRAEGEDRFDGLSDRLVSEERRTSRIRKTESRLLV